MWFTVRTDAIQFKHKLVYGLKERVMITEIKRIVDPETKLLSSFTHLHAFPNPYDFLEDLTYYFVFHRGNKIINESMVFISFCPSN